MQSSGMPIPFDFKKKFSFTFSFPFQCGTYADLSFSGKFYGAVGQVQHQLEQSASVSFQKDLRIRRYEAGQGQSANLMDTATANSFCV